MKVEEFDKYDYPINAKRLIEKMQERVWEQGRPPNNRTNEWISAFTTALNIVTNEPKCVVQCKECRFHEVSGLPCPLDVCETLGENGFCSCGERK